jgi:hypothetical protein
MIPQTRSRSVRRLALATLIVTLGFAIATPACARTIVQCAGAAMSGGAQLICNHLVPSAPAQLCTYTWALATMDNVTQVVTGTTLVPPGANNMTVYQGSGFAHAMSEPIVMCQGKRSH